MNALSKNILQATRLTRQGRLGEALALLRGAPLGRPDSEGQELEVAGDDSRDHAATPRHPEPEGTLFLPSASEPRLKGFAGRNTGGLPHGLLDPRGPLDSLRGLKGLARPAVGRAPSIPDGARFEERSFANASGNRHYKLYIPSRYTGAPLPLVVMLHGCTQSPDDFAAGTRMNELAEEHLFLVAYPAQPQTANSSKCWNWFNPGDQKRDRGEPSLIAGITRRIMDDFPVKPRHVYVAGLSAGGAAAAIMGATYPDLYGAIGIHSGLACGAASDLQSAFAAMRAGAAAGSLRQVGTRGIVPTIVFHGDQDMTVNLANGDQIITHAKAAVQLRADVVRGQASGLRYTRTVHVTEEGRPLLEQWVVHGGGHAWSGGSANASYTDPRGPDASREMVRFFLEQASWK